jgi:flagellar biosynthesis component FlhA
LGKKNVKSKKKKGKNVGKNKKKREKEKEEEERQKKKNEKKNEKTKKKKNQSSLFDIRAFPKLNICNGYNIIITMWKKKTRFCGGNEKGKEGLWGEATILS